MGWKFLCVACVGLMLVEYGEGLCGQPKVKGNRVVGGDDAVPGSWPWQVLMFRNYAPSCGGTLIAPQWVVTAAHCIEHWRNTPFLVKIRVGEHDTKKKETYQADYGVEKIIKYPTYNTYPTYNKLNDDIALLKLKKPVIMNEHVQPACLPDAQPPVGTECFITGWGKTKHPGNMHNILQQAKIPIVDSAVCYEKNKKVIQNPISDAMLCAGEEKKGWWKKPKIAGCHGDSGGPLVCQIDGQWEVHGAVSHGSPRCDARETYTVFARVFFFKKWILEQMKSN